MGMGLITIIASSLKVSMIMDKITNLIGMLKINIINQVHMLRIIIFWGELHKGMTPRL